MGKLTINLDKRVCPGCGRVDPESSDSQAFECKACGWTDDEDLPKGKMPTLRAIKGRREYICNDVNLAAFLRSIIGEEAEQEGEE